MRHRRKTVKLQRKTAHRDAMLTNQACSLIEHRQIKTTLAKAKALRPIAERLVTLGKRALTAEETKDAIHYRRLAFAKLGSSTLAQRSVKTLFDTIAPASAERQGGYTRITKLGQRFSDSAPMAYIEWVDSPRESSANAE
jgi:large subunit ribosomal protein L17